MIFTCNTVKTFNGNTLYQNMVLSKNTEKFTGKFAGKILFQKNLIYLFAGFNGLDNRSYAKNIVFLCHFVCFIIFSRMEYLFYGYSDKRSIDVARAPGL